MKEIKKELLKRKTEVWLDNLILAHELWERACSEDYNINCAACTGTTDTGIQLYNCVHTIANRIGVDIVVSDREDEYSIRSFEYKGKVFFELFRKEEARTDNV